MTTAVVQRRELAGALVAGGAVRSPWVRRAFEETPRERFVPRFYRSESGHEVLVDGTDPQQRDEWLRGVYADDALTVQLTPAPDLVDGAGAPTSSSSMPTVMAGMLEALDLQPGHRVLEIGTGTGYNAALLCHRVGADNVVSVELDPRLAHAARRALAGVGLHPAVHTGDGAAGLAAAAPFDRIIATASTDHIPPCWISQLTPGGSIVVDLRGSLDGSLLRLTAMDSDVAEGSFLNLPGAFMPLRTRSADNTWYRAATRLLGGRPKHVALLTATPINNTLWDLYNLVMLFARHDRALVPAGIDSIRALFVAAGANARDAELLDPDRLFPLADAVSVRRDRAFIVSNYPNSVFADGTPVRFPTPVLRTRRYGIDDVWPGLVARVSAAIGALSMARYRPSAFERGVAEDAGEASLAGLLQSAVLKRFESCWRACLATVQRMVSVHEAFLAGWDAGTVPSLEALREAAAREAETADMAEWLADLEQREGARPVSDFNPSYREAVADDLANLRDVRQALDQLSAQDDPKLALLADVLRETDGKVCIFASYAETVRYLDENLDAALGAARDRVTVIGADTTPDERTKTLSRFAPESVVERGYVPDDGEVDLLLSTDVLSEGQNLQQAGAVVSYDMPWNPQRVVQRNGRIIRLLSPHDTVALTTMLPEPGELESLLRLEARIQAKIVAAGVFGLESGVLEDVDTVAQNYHAEMTDLAARLEDGDETLLVEGEDTGGSFAGEQLRSLLLRAAAEGEVTRLRELPWGVGTAFRQGIGVPSRGPAGVFFACRTRTDPPQRYWRYVRDEDLDREDLPILRRIDPGAAPHVELDEDLEPAWRLTVDDIIREHNRRADPALVDNRLPASQRFALAVLRNPNVALPPGAEDADELLSVPRGAVVRTSLSEVQRSLASRAMSSNVAAERIVAIVREYGLTPVPPPPLLAPITEDDLVLQR